MGRSIVIPLGAGGRAASSPPCLDGLELVERGLLDPLLQAVAARLLARLVELLRWLRGGRCTHSPFCLMGTERRINFCVDSLSTRAPAQDHFFAQLAQKGLDYEPIPLADVPQAFEYSRSKELRLYRIRLAEEHYR